MALSNPGRTIRMAYRFCELATFDMALLFAMAHCVSAPTSNSDTSGQDCLATRFFYQWLAQLAK